MIVVSQNRNTIFFVGLFFAFPSLFAGFSQLHMNLAAVGEYPCCAIISTTGHGNIIPPGITVSSIPSFWPWC